MLSVVLYGDRKDRRLARLLREYLAREFTVQHFAGDRFESRGVGPELNLVETHFVRELALKNAILIVKQNARVDRLCQIGRDIPVVTDAANVRGLARLGPKRVYTCGYSPKDTITFSSRGEREAVVSLQRTVETGESRTCEPFELPCDLASETDDYSILAGVMALILMRRLSENSGRQSGKIYFSY